MNVIAICGSLRKGSYPSFKKISVSKTRLTISCKVERHHEFQELLGHALARSRPEACTCAAAQNHRVNRLDMSVFSLLLSGRIRRQAVAACRSLVCIW